jgi:hypothetical protein
MPSPGGDGDGALCHLLPADVCKVVLVVGELVEEFVEPRGRWLDVEFASEKGNRLCKAIDSDDVEFLNDCGFGGVRAGNNDAARVIVAGLCEAGLRRGAAGLGEASYSSLRSRGRL